MADFGGEMRFTVNGAPLVLRAAFKSEPSNVEIEGGGNQDGSTYRSLKPVGFMAEPAFQDSDVGVATSLDWNALLRGGPYNMTLVEDHTRRLCVWTAASFEGKPVVDHQNGEVTGIKIRSATYKRTSA
jgi:hypothetical protein